MSLEDEVKKLTNAVTLLTEVLLKEKNLPTMNFLIPKEENRNKLIPVPEWNDNHSWPPIGGIRNLIFNRKKNGLDKFKVIKKVGKRVLIDETAFFEWANNHPTSEK